MARRGSSGALHGGGGSGWGGHTEEMGTGRCWPRPTPGTGEEIGEERREENGSKKKKMTVQCNTVNFCSPRGLTDGPYYHNPDYFLTI